MPENPIHPGRNSTNTSKVPPETNLGQSALKSCLIYTHFSLALKPSVPALHPLPSPTGQGAPARSHPTHPPTPPQPGAAGLVPAVTRQSTEGDAWKLSPFPAALLPQASCSAENVTPAWLWQRRDLSSRQVCLWFWAGIFWVYASFKEAKFVLNNKVIALTYVHLAQVFIATCGRMHLCKAIINCVEFTLAITPWPAPETNLTHNI